MELCRLAPGQVLLTCRVPRERVLLSHFGDWHAVVNRRPLIIEHPDESDEAYGARLDSIFEDVDSCTAHLDRPKPSRSGSPPGPPGSGQQGPARTGGGSPISSVARIISGLKFTGGP